MNIWSVFTIALMWLSFQLGRLQEIENRKALRGALEKE
jgi:hypothetical protein